MAIAPSTRRAYERAVGMFQEFREGVGLKQVWPIPAVHLLQFCVAQRARGLAVKTIRGQLAALAFASKARGLPDSTGDFRIRKMLEGWSRESGVVRDLRQPISPAILRGLGSRWGEICSSGYECQLFHATSLTAFFGALRVSELVVQSQRDSSGRALSACDIQFMGGKVLIRIRKSKTDQKQAGSVLTLGPCEDKALCPVRALRSYVKVRGEDEGVLFRHNDRSPLTRYQFWAVTDRALRQLGLVGVKFGTHSFRIGAASTAAAMGYADRTIQKVGRWKSSAYRSYIRPLPLL
ncbi:uncharacterized protein LOC129340074 [Eublepharis macularius]|uniref:Uncharacterized protein LOC129340074 n=1 Tax=Eublepharis macularius TaxID=481883 RepID=A0AA97K366_EUBMA|nr:uncharacterized protein LOC129340074 [Eublepharis macularius]